ncbi:NAD(P)-binding protein [Xylariomycetidae sp. FL0641]|nr:NAD(P)-binding protein [Xylariomycetidae sp. FL0641]
MGAHWSQFFPPAPTYTESDVPPQDGKVFLITGGSSGIGFELAKMLYRAHARVYLAGRSAAKAEAAMQAIRAAAVASRGHLDFLHLELDDLRSVQAAAAAFRAREAKLHVLWNNAGVSRPPPAAGASRQGTELQLATNCLGPFLLTRLLLPLLRSTAAAEEEEEEGRPPPRVVWTSSQAAELSAPPQGLRMSELRCPPPDPTRRYVNSKTGNVFLAAELARREGGPSAPIVSVALNPGAARTELFRHTPAVKYLAFFLLYKPEMAALTQLYAGLSEDVTLERNGSYIVPWGRIATSFRADLLEAMKTPEEGGTGRAAEFWDFCLDMTRDYY